ncbi:uncharacterized protein UDID_17168 [Ustilago sp. UG-2017a]|nr:uncharacterized protein UDID_17168 [Ustilago sp. UG-2017a]
MSLVTLSNHACTERATNRGPDVYPFWEADLNNLYSRVIPPADSNLINTPYIPPQGTALHNCWINLIKTIRVKRGTDKFGVSDLNPCENAVLIVLMGIQHPNRMCALP